MYDDTGWEVDYKLAHEFLEFLSMLLLLLSLLWSVLLHKETRINEFPIFLVILKALEVECGMEFFRNILNTSEKCQGKGGNVANFLFHNDDWKMQSNVREKDLKYWMLSLKLNPLLN